jgi:chromosome segregation ATPase
MQTTEIPNIKLEANRIAAMNKTLSDLTTQLNNEVSMLNIQLGEKGKEITTIKTRLAQKDQQVAAMRDKVQKQDREILRLQQSAKTIMDGAAHDKLSGRQKAKVAKLEKTIGELTEKNQKLEARNAKLEREFKEVVVESADRWHKIRALKVDHDIARIRSEKVVAEMGEVMRASVCCSVHLLTITHHRSSR